MKKVVIDCGAVKENIGAIKKKAESAAIIADLSCNAGGLGLLPTASLLRDEGVRAFAVSEAEDVERLRQGGFVDEHVLMLRSTVDTREIERICDAGGVCTIGSLEAGIAANSVAEARSTVIEAQIKVDSGPGQYGFLPTEMDKMIRVFRNLPGLVISGIYTRLSNAEAGRSALRRQLETFENVLVRLSDAGVETGTAHALNSYALFRGELDRLDAVCVGSAVRGRTPGLSDELTPVGYVEADIEELKWLPEGSQVGEGKGVRLKKSTKVAVVSVGWFHGLGLASPEDSPGLVRRLLNRAADRPEVTVNGRRMKILGRIYRDYMLLDASDIDCGVGDKAILSVDPALVKGIPLEYR